MTKTSFSLLALFFTLFSQGSGANHLLNESKKCDDSPDCIPIIKGEKNYYVEASAFEKTDKRENNTATRETAKSMMLSLSTSETFIISNRCEGFLPYDCTQFDCEECSGSNLTTHQIYFSADGCETRANLHLENLWLSKGKVFQGNACHDGKITSTGEGTYGIIGLGIEGSGKSNFRDLVFTIYLHEDNTGGELWAGRNLYKAESTTPEIILNSTGSWHNYGIENIQVENYMPAGNFTAMNMIFHLDAFALGFPSHIYWKILEDFQKGEIPLKCWEGTTNLYRPNCSYNGRIADLPNITITILGQKFTIPLSIFVDSPESYNPARGWIILNINGHNTTNANVPETFVTKNYEDSIILDSNFMKHFAIVFDGLNSKIEIYKIRQDSSNSDSNDLRAMFILGGILFIAVFGMISGVTYYTKKSQQNLNINNNNQIEEPLAHYDAVQQDQDNIQAVHHSTQGGNPSPPQQDQKKQNLFNASAHGVNQTNNEEPSSFQHRQSHQMSLGEHLLVEDERKTNDNIKEFLNFDQPNLQSEKSYENSSIHGFNNDTINHY